MVRIDDVERMTNFANLDEARRAAQVAYDGREVNCLDRDVELPTARPGWRRTEQAKRCGD